MFSNRVIAAGVVVTVLVVPAGVNAQSCLAWVERAPTIPPAPRYSHAATYDVQRGRVVLFGGRAAPGTPLGDTWEWDGASWTEMHVPGPSPRFDHAMAYDNARKVAVLFGGDTGASYLNDTWEWNGSAWTNIPTTVEPSLRAYHAMAFDTTRNLTLLFGGSGGEGYFNELWSWNGTAWTLTTTSGPAPRLSPALAFDTARGVLVLFGGFSSTLPSIRGDTWEWNGTAWNEPLIPGPSPRTNSALTYDPVKQRALLFGGQAVEGTKSDTWAFKDGAWSALNITGPAPRLAHSLTYDIARNASVLFGGYTPLVGERGDTWTLVADDAPSITQQPIPAKVYLGRPASFSVVATGQSTPSYRWRKDLIDLADGTTITGTTTPTLSISAVTFDDAGLYDVRVTSDCGQATSNQVALSVLCPADFDGNGFVTGDDYDFFVDAFYTGDPSADFDLNGFITGDDFDFFSDAFAAGC